MKILLVNDDGIGAKGLEALLTALEGEHSLSVVAPATQQSAVSRAMTLYSPLRADRKKLPGRPDIEAWAVYGTPVDCIRLGLGNLVSPPELVISGINHGPNLGTDTLYSGTCAGAQEAALMGLPSIALSCCGFLEESRHDVAAEMVREFLPYLQSHPLPFGAFYNVNVPDSPREAVRGFKLARLGLVRYDSRYCERHDLRDRAYYWAPRSMNELDCEEGTDVAAIRQGYASVTPLSFDCALPTEYGKIW